MPNAIRGATAGITNAPDRRQAAARLSGIVGPLYHAILTCDGLTEAEAANAPADIVDEFRNRPWHHNVKCRWDGRLLWLEADNDYDEDGRALLDEFGDAVIACVNAAGTIHFEIVSVLRVDAGERSC